MRDILFFEEDFVFSYRIAGVLVQNGKALLQRSGGDYALIGGHVAAMEQTKETLKREFLEELHAEVKVGELLAVGEVFFPWGDKPCHQIFLSYAAELADGAAIPMDGVFHGYDELGGKRFDLDFCWVPLAELDKIRLYPPELIPVLRGETAGVLDFVYREK